MRIDEPFGEEETIEVPATVGSEAGVARQALGNLDVYSMAASLFAARTDSPRLAFAARPSYRHSYWNGARSPRSDGDF